MKKRYIVISVICLLLLCVALTVGMIMNKDTDSDGDVFENVIVHDTNKDTVEEESEDGLKESDSEDGPVLNEETIIDFNGNDEKKDSDKKNESTSEKQEDSEDDDSDNLKDEEGTENNTVDDNKADIEDDTTEDNKKEEDSKDTGSWGVFY